MVPLRLPHSSVSPMCLLTLTLAILYRLPYPVAANYEHYCDAATFRIQRNGQCGESLANTILSLCRALSETFVGKYMIMKRMSSKGQVNKRLSDISLTRADAFSYLSKRQMEQNIVCECCVNRCSFTEMYQYCNLPPLNFKRGRRTDDDVTTHERHNSSPYYNSLEDSNYLGST